MDEAGISKLYRPAGKVRRVVCDPSVTKNGVTVEEPVAIGVWDIAVMTKSKGGGGHLESSRCVESQMHRNVNLSHQITVSMSGAMLTLIT